MNGIINNSLLGQDTILSSTAPDSASAGLTLGYLGNNDTNTRYYGAFGGDVVIGTGFGKASEGVNKVEKAITGNIDNHLNGGAVLGGVGGSAAIGIGGINKYSNGYEEDFSPLLNGEAHVTVDGNITTNIEKDVKTVGFFNGGLAASIGAGTKVDDANTTVSMIPSATTSTVNGSTSLIINGGEMNPSDYHGDTDTVTKVLDAMWQNKINAAGVVGGGAAVSTLGGNAQATVRDNSGITLNNATVAGVIGGGAAVSADATGLAGLVLHNSYGNEGTDNDMGYTHKNPYTDVDTEAALEKLEELGVDTSGFSALLPSLIGNTVYIENVNEGGTATSTVGSVGIEIKGNSAAAGVIGGGLAAAEHMYAAKTGENANQPLGSSSATASVTGDTTIVINMAQKVDNISTVMGEDGELNLSDLANSNIVVGVAGGGAAAAFGDANTTAIADSQNTTIDIQKGYVTGAFGGGIAVAAHDTRTQRTGSDVETNPDHHLTASATVNDTHVNVGKDSTAVGVFGNGLAVGMEFEDQYHAEFNSTDNKRNPDSGTNASVTAHNTNVTIAGNADAVFGGGLLLSNGAYGGDSVKLDTTGTSTIKVTGNGHVENTNYQFLNQALESIGAAINRSEDDPVNEDHPLDENDNILGKKADFYVDDLNNAAGNVAILGGHVAVGQGGYAHTNESVINLTDSSTVKGDIVAGGISDVVAGTYGTEASDAGVVVEKSTINLAGDKVEAGSVYAGGIKVTDSWEATDPEGIADPENMAESIVKDSTVNLMGMDIAGEISGAGYEYASSKKSVYGADLGTSTLNLIGENTLSALGEGNYTSTSKIHDFDTIVAKAGSETILDGSLTTSSPAVIDGGNFTAEDGAYLNIKNLKTGYEDSGSAGNTYKVIANADKNSAFWDDSDLIYDRMSGVFATTEVTTDTGDTSGLNVKYEAVTEENADEAAQSMADALDAEGATGLFQQGMRDGWKNVNEGAGEFFDDWQNHKDSNAAFGKGMMLGEDAAVTGNTVSIARDMADNVMQRLSFTDDYVQDAGWVNNDGGIWAKYIHRKYETDNMGSSFGGIHSSTDYDGAIVGVDFAKHGNFQSGVAFHYGSGDGNGLISRNDYDAWGFTLYGSLKDEEAGTNLMADIGYVTSDNDIDGTVNGKSMSADRDVDAWTIGLRGEKEYIFGQNQLVPYVGLRYMSVNPGRYTSYYGGQKAFDYDADNQNLWLLPIGVSFRNETKTDSGWRITPKLDLSYIWAFGDTDTDMTLDMGGVGSGLYYDVMDDNSWLASLGVEATKDVWSFGVGYGYQKGDDTKNKTWFVNASYAF